MSAFLNTFIWLIYFSTTKIFELFSSLTEWSEEQEKNKNNYACTIKQEIPQLLPVPYDIQSWIKIVSATHILI